MNKSSFSVERKNRKKLVRTLFQILILLLSIYFLVMLLFFPKRYVDPEPPVSASTDTGFIALSYFGVDRTSSIQSLISTKRLDEHLSALKQAGYETITQQDILDYYQLGKPLPEKSLYLLFEDGRRDTAIFVQPLLEKFNYMATALTYAENLTIDTPKFLHGKDLLDLAKNTYWELGSNGYRLAYINVFDRHGNFLDVLNTLQFQMMQPFIDRRYDHYLMDFIRDEYGIPKESLEEMRERLTFDYEGMREIYTQELGAVPQTYVIMHSNSDYFASNPKAGQVNAKWIPELFEMHFNREGLCYNLTNSSIYDLTRMQPSPYWYANHLLMRIWDDTKHEFDFVVGDEEKSRDWELLSGAAEFKEEKIILTTLPKGKSSVRWNGGSLQNLRLTTALDGNKVGGQAIYLRAGETRASYLSVNISNNIFYVKEKGRGTSEKILFEMNLDEFDGVYIQSIEENRREAEARKFEMDARYATTPQDARDNAVDMNRRLGEEAPTIVEGADEYVPEIEIREFGHRLLDITLIGDELTVLVDERPMLEGFKVNLEESGHIFLEAEETAAGYSERKLYDDVYDGVFTDLVIQSLSEDINGDTSTLFDNRQKGFDKFKAVILGIWNTILDWFIQTL